MTPAGTVVLTEPVSVIVYAAHGIMHPFFIRKTKLSLTAECLSVQPYRTSILLEINANSTARSGIVDLPSILQANFFLTSHNTQNRNQTGIDMFWFLN